MQAWSMRHDSTKFGGKLWSVFAHNPDHASDMHWKKAIISAGFWLLCLVALVMISGRALAAQTAPSRQNHTAIVFFADRSVDNELWPSLFQVLQSDLSAENGDPREAVLPDRNPALFRSSDLVKGIDFADVVEVKLLGRCDVVPQAYRPLPKGPLGWVSLVSGEIQPFVFIDCTRLALLIGPATLGLDREGRRQAMSQAISHVLIHEWIHIVTQSASHSSQGIEQANLTVSELLGGPIHNHERLLAHNRENKNSIVPLDTPAATLMGRR